MRFLACGVTTNSSQPRFGPLLDFDVVISQMSPLCMAALALDLFDGVPQIGSQCAAGSPDLTLIVLGMDGPRIVKVLLQTRD